MARSDAQRNRQLLLTAARELFAEADDVPMYEIGKRAGVGQATLYRHFPDRDAIALALFAEQLDRFEALAEAHAGDPDRFFVLLRSVAEAQVGFGQLASCLYEPEPPALDTSGLPARFVALMEPALAEAKAARQVRDDFTLDDVYVVLGMVAGAAARTTVAAQRAAAGRRALDLALEGIRLA